MWKWSTMFNIKMVDAQSIGTRFWMISLGNEVNPLHTCSPLCSQDFTAELEFFSVSTDSHASGNRIHDQDNLNAQHLLGLVSSIAMWKDYANHATHAS